MTREKAEERAKYNAAALKWYHENSPRLLTERRSRYATDPTFKERVLATNMKARIKRKLNSPDKVRAQRAADRSRRRALEFTQLCGCCTQADITALYAEQVTGSTEVDHKICLALGGPHCIKNLQILSVESHKEKSAHDMRKLAEVRLRNRLFKTWPVSSTTGI